MSKYTYIVRDYHAISKAEISIDGITVLSGENGSGKSTLSRWLYYLVKSTNEYEKYISKSAKYEVRVLLEKIRRASMIMSISKAIGTASFYRMLEDLNSAKDIEQYKDRYSDIVSGFLRSLSEYSEKRTFSRDMPRLASLFNIDIEENTDPKDVLLKVSDRLFEDFANIEKAFAKRRKTRTADALASVIADFASSGDDGIIDVKLYEDGVNLLDRKEFKAPLMLNRAIYYGTQRTMNSLDDYSEFNSFLKTPIGETPEQGRVIKMKMQHIMNGSVTFEKNEDLLYDEAELHYRRKDGLNIPLKQAATGLISFACLERLLENGYLTQDTLLIIDEPEAHLHPQWIVEYARILVLLNKQIGLKILISSHNPDMVAAIQSIARKEGVLDTTHFYLAQKEQKNDLRFYYKDLGTDIGEIFESFNIALSRIQMYGANED